MNMSLVLPLPRDLHLSKSSSNVPRLPSFLQMLQNPHVLLTFDFEMGCAPQQRALFRHFNFQKYTIAHFDLETCFAPQHRALFRQLNFQKCSERDVF